MKDYIGTHQRTHNLLLNTLGIKTDNFKLDC